jgi:hypothetical protein
MSGDPLDPMSGADLREIINAVERMKDAAEAACGITPEMMAGLGQAGAAYDRGSFHQERARRAGKTADFFIGLDRANRRGERTAFTVRDRHGRLITCTFEPTERVTPESVRRKVREAVHGADVQRAIDERDRERNQYEHDAEKAGHRVVEGTVLGRTFEREPA